MMTPRRRILTLLGGGTPDRVPWFADLDYWATALPESFSNGPVERLVKSEKNLPAYRFYLENTRYESDYGLARERADLVGAAGIVLCCLPRTPLMRMTVQDAGIEAIAMIDADAPGELAETVDAARRNLEPAVRLAVDSPAEVLMIPENLSSEVVGPGLFDRHIRDIHASWVREISRAGKKSCIHMDGTLRGLLERECSMGLTFIEAMTPAPAGDLRVEEWASYRGGTDTVFWGGIPGPCAQSSALKSAGSVHAGQLPCRKAPVGSRAWFDARHAQEPAIRSSAFPPAMYSLIR